MGPSSFSRALALAVSAGACWILGTPNAQAQTVFCPRNAVGESGFASVDGACTNGLTGSFSGAALASQALSSLSQTTTQETTRASVTSITERREQEAQRCAEGFTRVDGACRRVPPEVSAAVPVAAPVSAPTETTRPRPPEVAAAPRGGIQEPRAHKLVPVDGRPPAPLPLPIEPAVRYGAWTQAYGDYESRSATGSASVLCCVIGGITSPLPLSVSVQSRTGTVGFQAGLDFTSRGLIASGDGLIAGALVGYLTSNMTLNSSAISSDYSLAQNEFARLSARLSGPTLGLYATYFDNGFSADFLFKVDILRLDQTFQDSLAFCACFEPAISSVVPFSGSGSVDLLNTTLAGNLNYRFVVAPNFWIEPTVGAQSTLTTYGANAALLGLDDGSLVRVQGGARLGMPVWLDPTTLMTTTVTGLAYSDVLVNGGFVPGAGFAGNNLLAQADRGQVRGRGVVAVNLDYGNGITSFVQGEARGGTGLLGAGGKAGVRIVW